MTPAHAAERHQQHLAENDAWKQSAASHEPCAYEDIIALFDGDLAALPLATYVSEVSQYYA